MKKLLLLLVALVLAVPAGEIAIRIVHRARGEPYDADATHQRFLTIVRAANGDLVPAAPREGEPRKRQEMENTFFVHPFYAWETKPNQAWLIEHVDAFRKGLWDDDYVIVVVGGSVAGQFVEPNTGASEVLARALEADPRFAGRKVRVLSHGRGAFKQPQQVFVVEWLLALGVVPDAVINIDGFNEVAISNQNRGFHVHPLFPSFAQWGPRLRGNLITGSPVLADALTERRIEMRDLAQQAVDRHYAKSAFLGPWALGRVVAAEQRWRDAQRALLESAWDEDREGDVLGPPFDGGEDEAIELGVKMWREGTLDLEAICSRRGIAYLHVLQPTLHDEGSKPVTDEERKVGQADPAWRQGVRRGYPRLREEGAALRASGFPFHDATRVFATVEESLYFDACHFRRKGNAILAESIAAAFLELALPQ